MKDISNCLHPILNGYNMLSEIFKSLKMKYNDSAVANSHGKYDSFLDLAEQYCGSFENKTVLEIGSDWNGTLLNKLKFSSHAKAVYGTNLKSPDKEISPGVYHLCRNAEETGFPAGEFDVVLSLATFEHIHNLPKVLDESWRILKKGGVIFTLFGPIWSSAFGHHLWVNVNGNTYNYINTELSSFCHLLSNKEEVFDYLVRVYGYPAEHCEHIAEYVFNSIDQNRLFFGDYRHIFASSAFQVLLFAGHKNIPFHGKYNLENYLETLKTVALRYPERHGEFGYNAITALLYKA